MCFCVRKVHVSTKMNLNNLNFKNNLEKISVSTNKMQRIQNTDKNYERLKDEQKVYLETCNSRIENWEKYKADYVNLRTRLETLPHQLNYEIMVPISKVAFIPGKLVHTNELLILLGDNWFAERSFNKHI